MDKFGLFVSALFVLALVTGFLFNAGSAKFVFVDSSSGLAPASTAFSGGQIVIPAYRNKGGWFGGAQCFCPANPAYILRDGCADSAHTKATCATSTCEVQYPEDMYPRSVTCVWSPSSVE